MLAQVRRWAVALTMTGQTSACHWSDWCRPMQPTSSKQGKEDFFSKIKAQKQAWTRNYKE
jgi:hypothetical protein